MLSALVLALSLSAPANTSAAGPAFLPMADPAARVEIAEPDFFGKYLPFSLNQDASQQAKDSMVMSIVLSYVGCIVCAPVWAPVLVTKDAEFNGDVVAAALISYVVWVGVSIVTSPLGIGLLTGLAWPYSNALATLNAADRDIRRRALGGTGTPKALPPSGTPVPGGGNGETPPPSYAY